jgi:23S rRNA (cytosine1962-C5)-methyltransferase
MERRLEFLVTEVMLLPCILFEDDHLLAINKPAGMNTHAPSPYAPEGMYEWLRDREPRWANLAIIHRLDKETSGVLIFSKTELASRFLTKQFTDRQVRKTYSLETDCEIHQSPMRMKTGIARSGERYVTAKLQGMVKVAETVFHVRGRRGSIVSVEAEPVTGRTHQIRVHAAEAGFPVLGDVLYGGTPALRVHLHASAIQFKHPSTGSPVEIKAPANFAADPRIISRSLLLDPNETNLFRVINGAAERAPAFYLERLGDFLLCQSEGPLNSEQIQLLETFSRSFDSRGVYQKLLSKELRKANRHEVSARKLFGEDAPHRLVVRENGVNYELSFNEGYSVGLFVDQRDNRRRLLNGHVAAGFEPLELRGREVLNTFAYTCGFSVCAALAGAHCTSIDLSRKYLDWGKRNFVLNGLNPTEHQFIFGDTFDWLNRFRKKQRGYDMILLDPPTFSQSRESGVFKVDRDLGRLTANAVQLLRPGGLLFASCNAADWPPDEFMAAVEHGVNQSKRSILLRHFSPQPPDFPVSRSEPAYFKSVWMRIA